MRTLFSAIAMFGLVLGARSADADKGPVVTADCKTAITSSTVGGFGIRVISGGFTPGMQAYIHELPSTNSKTKDPVLFGAVNVKFGIKPMNNTVEMVLVSTDAASQFQLSIKKAKTSGGQNTATLIKAELGGKK